MLIFGLIMGHWFISLFCQSFFLHRYCSHRMFKMNKFWERFFYLLTYLSQGPSFLNPSSYSIMHQRHHAHSDTNKDPHSPHNSKGPWKMMIKTYRLYKDLTRNYEFIEDKSVTHRAPKWRLLDKFALTHYNTLLWALIYIGIYKLLNIEIYYYFFIPFHFLVGPIQGAIVNWFGHKLGYRNYNTNDQSKNSLPLDFALMGELYQNNHHRFGQKLNFAHRWFEIDLTYQLSKVLRLFKVIELKELSE